MTVKLALAGNPNTGKTTLFNALTGSKQKVGNWPGVTVEKKRGRLKADSSVWLEDLPGIYSLSPYSSEEIISRNYILEESPDLILNIVDASSLERNLYLTSQLTELGIPVVVALNMMDIAEKAGIRIDCQRLSEALGCPVAPISALRWTGVAQLTEAAIVRAENKLPYQPPQKYPHRVERVIREIAEILEGRVASDRLRWYAIKTFERDAEVVQDLNLSEDQAQEIEGLIDQVEAAYDDDSEGIMASSRYEWVSQIIADCVQEESQAAVSFTDRVDAIVTNRFLALPIFALVMYLVYYLAVSTIGKQGTDWVNDQVFGEFVPEHLGGLLASLGVSDWLQALIMDGIVAGVGAVLGFLPQMMVLFACLAFLEDCGYMARIAFVLDRVFRKFGLSGKSFIPILVSTGCGVPGIMAARTIENDNDRRLTIMTTTFIPCGAKLPIIALITGAFFPNADWVALSTYFMGIGAIVLSGIMLKKTRWFAGDPAPFVIELPAYHLPSLSGVLRTVFERTKAFVKKAGTIVLLSTVLIWSLQSFDWQFNLVETGDSILASLGRLLAPLFVALGWGDWRAAVASVTGLLAKENLVGTFGILFGYAEAAEDGADFWPQLSQAFTPIAGYSLMTFNLLCVPCMAAVGALRREMMDDKMTLFAVIYQCLLAYAISLMIYQFGTWWTTGHFDLWTGLACLTLAGMLYMVFFKRPYQAKPALADIRRI